jgi:hypothetical protein
MTGDFSAQIKNNNIVLPLNLYHILKEMDVRNVEDFLSLIHAFPTSLALKLDWELTDVAKAKIGLVALLKGKMAAELLEPLPSKQRSFGAIDPNS